MAEKGYRLFLLFAVTMGLISALAIMAWPLGLLLCAMNIGSFAIGALVFRFTRPAVLKRRINLDNWWDRFLPPIIGLAALASVALSVYDVTTLEVSLLPSWAFLLGVVLLMSAYMIFTQSMRAQAPHAMEKYGEAAVGGHERGPYDVIRHPAMLAVLLGGLSLPLFLGSGIGFIPIVVLVAAVVAHVAAEDNWRFNNYEWFYDYTKEVSYRLIPFIW